MTVLCICVLIASLASACGTRAVNDSAGNQAGSTARESSLAVVESPGIRVSLKAIDLVTEREVLPGSGDKMVAKPGREFAVIRISIKFSGLEGNLDVQRLSLVDSAGNSYKPAAIRTSACDARSGDTGECELPFDVPAGASFTKFRVDANESAITAAP